MVVMLWKYRVLKECGSAFRRRLAIQFSKTERVPSSRANRLVRASTAAESRGQPCCVKEGRGFYHRDPSPSRGCSGASPGEPLDRGEWICSRAPLSRQDLGLGPRLRFARQRRARPRRGVEPRAPAGARDQPEGGPLVTGAPPPPETLAISTL
jgi:hypothetical protein